ncbi:MAG: alanine racemase [Spirochaetes bacterium]|nr:MAG: alanine racemase [Spirochaetota bacterium]
MTGRRTYAYIQMDNLRANLAEIRHRAEPAKICAMIKADAYGHGAVPIAEVLQAEKVEYLAVALLEEALELKDAGISTPILVLGTASVEDAEIIVSRGITQSIYDLEIARALSKAASALNTTALVHIKIDTGMSRQGILAEEAFAFASVLKTLPGIAVEGIYSHFSEADNPDTGFATLQMRRFGEAIEGLKRAGIEPKYRHIANSGAILTMPFTGLDMVRPGILLYGLSPSGAIKVVRRRLHAHPLQPRRSPRPRKASPSPGENLHGLFHGGRDGHPRGPRRRRSDHLWIRSTAIGGTLPHGLDHRLRNHLRHLPESA